MCTYINDVTQLSMKKLKRKDEGLVKVPIFIGYLAQEAIYVHIKYALREYEHKFLWMKWRTYSCSIHVPYIENASSAKEVQSNKLLQVRSAETRAMLEEEMRKWKEEHDKHQ